jgi:hypothetical protein
MFEGPGREGFHSYDQWRAEDKAKAGPALWIDDDDWIEADIPPRPWVVPGYALRGSVTVLCGPPSALKSSLVLAWGCSLALNQAFGRFAPLAEGTMLIYNVEDDKQEQRRRLSATLRQFVGGTPESIKGRIIRSGPEHIGTLLNRSEDGIISFTPAMEKMEELIRDQRPDVLVCDPLAELHNCEENDNNALRAVVAEFRRLAVLYNMAVVILHHTRKGSNTSPGDPDIARGASAIIGAARIVLTVTSMSEADAEALGVPTDPVPRSHFVRMDDAKANYTALRDVEWFEKRAYPLDNGEWVAAAVPWTPPAAKIASESELVAMATAIGKGSPNGEPWSQKLSKEPRSVRALLEQFGFHGSAQKGALARLMNECDVEAGHYTRPGSRMPAGGLRVGALPAAKWIDEDSDAAA